LSATQRVFDELKIKIPFICMAKGENRNAGEEKFYRVGGDGEAEIVASDLAKHHPVMHYLQRLRDEAHRFAIMTHRKKREKSGWE
jgi:excinuclease ABC subunit C